MGTDVDRIGDCEQTQIQKLQDQIWAVPGTVGPEGESLCPHPHLLVYTTLSTGQVVGLEGESMGPAHTAPQPPLMSHTRSLNTHAH